MGLQKPVSRWMLPQDCTVRRYRLQRGHWIHRCKVRLNLAMPGRSDRVIQRLENLIYVERMIRHYAQAALLADSGSELSDTKAHVHAVCFGY